MLLISFMYNILAISKCQFSSAVEQLAVNQLVTSSILVIGASLWSVGEAVNTHGFHPCIHGFDPRTDYHYGRLAQLGEHRPYKAEVVGSSPSSSTICPKGLFIYIICIASVV